MSVSLLTQNSAPPTLLGNNVGFGTMVGGSLTIGSLIVTGSAKINSIETGEDTIPDVYQYGVIPSSYLWDSSTAGTGTADGIVTGVYRLGGNVGTSGQVVRFVSPVYFNPVPSASSIDPLMPYVGTGVSHGLKIDGVGAQNPTGSIYPMYYTLVCGNDGAGNADFTAVGATFGLITLGAMAGTTYATSYKDSLYSYFLAGAPPLQPPSAWGTITPSAIAGAGAGYKRWQLAVSGGIIGTSAAFPATGTLSLQPSASAAAASIVYPVNLTTPPADVAAYGDNSAFVPGTSTATKGIWVQQVWWVQNAQGTTPALYFNVTHLFTIAGNSTSASLSATPLNTITNVNLSARTPTPEQGLGDGAFNITLDMPTTVVTTSGSGATPASVRGYTFNASKNYTNNSQGTLLDDICTGDVTTGRSFNTTNNGSWVIYLATTNSQAVSSTCRASNNLLAATGGGSLGSANIGTAAGAGQNYVGGVFSINPRNNAKTASFPVDISYAGNLTQAAANTGTGYPFTAGANAQFSDNNGLPALVYPGNTNDGIVLAG